jgi:hypothetical protein
MVEKRGLGDWNADEIGELQRRGRTWAGFGMPCSIVLPLLFLVLLEDAKGKMAFSGLSRQIM